MTKSPVKYSSIIVLIATVTFLLSSFSAQAMPFDISGSTTVDQDLVDLEPDILNGINATAGLPGDFLIIESGIVISGQVDFNGFPYELFNRGIINGSSPGVFCGVDCTIHNDGFGAQIFGDGPAGIHITGAGAAEVFNSGLFAVIEGLDTGVQIEGGGLVENSGENATITGLSTHGVFIDEGDGTVNNTGMNAEIIGGMNGVYMDTTTVTTSVSQIVSNSGIDSRIEGLAVDGVDLFATDSLIITQSVDNSGVGSIIIGSGGHGVDINADGNTGAADGTSIMQTVTNSGADALIDGRSDDGIEMGAEDSLVITQTVTNSGAGADIIGNVQGIDFNADGTTGAGGNSASATTITQTVTNSGADATIVANTDDGINFLAVDSLAIVQLLDNTGAGARITGGNEGVQFLAEGLVDGTADGTSIMQTVNNSGAGALIQGDDGEIGIEVDAYDALVITQLVDNSGADATIIGGVEGINLDADGFHGGLNGDNSVSGNTIMQSVLNSGANALIENHESGSDAINLDAVDSLAITQLVDNSGAGARITGNEDGVNLFADGLADGGVDGDTISQTVNNSGAGAEIEGQAG
jgi:hypothetical protein